MSTTSVEINRAKRARKRYHKYLPITVRVNRLKRLKEFVLRKKLAINRSEHT